jgi:hypothetical protein
LYAGEGTGGNVDISIGAATTGVVGHYVVNGIEPQRAHSLWLQLMYVDSYINNFCYEECLLMLLKPIMILGVYLKEVHEYGFRLSDLDLE